MVDVLASVMLPLGAPALELFPCLGLAVLGVALGRPRPVDAPAADPIATAPPANDSPWEPPAEG